MGLAALGKKKHKNPKCAGPVPYYGTFAKYRQACNKQRKTLGTKWNAQSCRCIDAYGREWLQPPVGPQPFPNPLPPQACPVNYGPDPVSGQCVPMPYDPCATLKMQALGRPVRVNPMTGQCEYDPTTQCPQGYVINATGQCVPQNLQSCPQGYVLNSMGQCIPMQAYQGPNALYPYGPPQPNLNYPGQYNYAPVSYGGPGGFDNPGLMTLSTAGVQQQQPMYQSSGPTFSQDAALETGSGGDGDIGLPADFVPFRGFAAPQPSAPQNFIPEAIAESEEAPDNLPAQSQAALALQPIDSSGVVDAELGNEAWGGMSGIYMGEAPAPKPSGFSTNAILLAIAAYGIYKFSKA